MGAGCAGKRTHTRTPTRTVPLPPLRTPHLITSTRARHAQELSTLPNALLGLRVAFPRLGLQQHEYALSLSFAATFFLTRIVAASAATV